MIKFLYESILFFLIKHTITKDDFLQQFFLHFCYYKREMLIQFPNVSFLQRIRCILVYQRFPQDHRRYLRSVVDLLSITQYQSSRIAKSFLTEPRKNLSVEKEMLKGKATQRSFDAQRLGNRRKLKKRTRTEKKNSVLCIVWIVHATVRVRCRKRWRKPGREKKILQCSLRGWLECLRSAFENAREISIDIALANWIR